MTKARVLVVGQGAPTKGGIPTFVATLLADDWLTERVALEYLNTTPRSEKRPGAFSITNLGLALSHAWQVFNRARRVDLVHLNLSPAPILPLVRALALSVSAKAAGAKVVLHAHSGRLERCARRPLYRFLLAVTMIVVDRFVAVSRNAERAIPFKRTKVVRVQNGIRVDGPPTGPKEADPPTLMFVGTVCERKGLIDLRDALVQIGTPMRVLIVGDSEQEGPDVFGRIKGAYANANLSNVAFLGAVDRAQVADLLGRAGMFCLPSHWEGFPLSLLEAMAAETAIVATAVGDVPFMLDAGRAGLLIEPRDVRGLAAAITRLARDPDERIRLGRAARTRAEDLFDHQQMIRSLFDVYSSTLGHST